jgi:hypothetical protein
MVVGIVESKVSLHPTETTRILQVEPGTIRSKKNQVRSS